MQTTAIGLGQMLGQEAQPEISACDPGFAATLREVQSGAPPGPEPPPEKVTEAGAVTQTPNAGAQTLDLLPKDTESQDPLMGEALPVDLLALLAAQVTPTPALPVLVSVSGDAGGTPALPAAIEGDPAVLPVVPDLRDGAVAEPRVVVPAQKAVAVEVLPTPELRVGEFVEAVVSTLPKADAQKLEADLVSVTTAPEESAPQAEVAINAQAIPVKVEETAIKPSTTSVSAFAGRSEQSAEGAGQDLGNPSQQAPQSPSTDAKAVKTVKVADVVVSAAGEPDIEVGAKPAVKAEGDASIEILNPGREVVGAKATAAPSNQAVGLSAEKTAQVIRQTADRLELLAVARSNETVTVRLDPQDLGSITMIVKSVGNQIDASITASNDQVRAALEQNRFQLGQTMQERGLNLGSLNVASQSPSGQASADQQMRHAHQQQAHQSKPQASFSRDLMIPTLDVQRAFARSTSGVDVWI